MTPETPAPRDVRVLAIKLGIRPRVLLRPGRVWIVETLDDARYTVHAENRPDVSGVLEVHWCDADCPNNSDPTDERWRLRPSSKTITMWCRDTFAQACDVIATVNLLECGGYALTESDQLALYRGEEDR